MFLHNASVSIKGNLVTLRGTEKLLGKAALESNDLSKEFEHTYDTENEFECGRLEYLVNKYCEGWQHKGLLFKQALKELEKVSQDLDSENKGIYVWEYWKEQK